MRRRPTAALLASTGPRDHAANCPLGGAPIPLLPPTTRNPRLGQTVCAVAYVAMRCYALRKDSQHFCGPVDWLQDCGVAFLGESRGRRGVWDDPSDARSKSRCPGQPCCIRPVVLLCAVDVNRMDERIDNMRLRSVAAGGQRKSCRHTHTPHTARSWRSAGCFLGKRLPRLGAALGKKDVQLANNNPPVTRSPVCLAPPRTSSESGSGLRTKVTLWSPPLTRRVRTQLSTRSSLTPRLSSPLREFPLFRHQRSAWPSLSSVSFGLLSCTETNCESIVSTPAT